MRDTAECAEEFFFWALPSFVELVKTLKPIIAKRNSNTREAVTVSQSLGITLQYLATGNAFEDL